MVFSEGERKPEASSGETPRFASTRAHSGSIPASRASSETTAASGSRSRQRARQDLPNANQAMLRHYTGSFVPDGPGFSEIRRSEFTLFSTRTGRW
jgi:hypothetical protein